jgi:serine/threonine-protein kinase PRP4
MHRGRTSETSGKSHLEQSVSEPGTTPNVAQSSKTYTENGTNQASQDTAKTSDPASADKCVLASVNRRYPNSTFVRDGDPTASIDNSGLVMPPILDEAAQIEERRKRREALKNKYRGQATPLRIQALHLDGDTGSPASGANTNQDDPGTPGSNPPNNCWCNRLIFTASPISTSPQTPRDTSGPQSPTDFNLDKNEDVSKANADPDLEEDRDEPSAADYDPTIDMQEERSRHDKHLFNEDMSVHNFQDEHQAIGSTEPTIIPSPPRKPKDTFDMFAEDEDDDLDMFAEAPAKPTKDAKTETKVAQALDVNMMDNWDDPEGYYNTILGELIQGRYHVQQNLGRGMFASVVRARDNRSSRDVAIKIIRNNESMFKAGKKEIHILQDRDPT